jgi:hypothetical protein
MSRILLTPLIILSLSFSARAQFNKGSILLGVQLSYSYNTYNSTNPNIVQTSDQKTNMATFNISVGKAIKENTVFGIILTYSPYAVNNYYSASLGPLKYSDNYYAFGIFYRKYKSLGKDFFIFGEGSAYYEGSTISGKDSLGQKVLSGSTKGGVLIVYPGISYKVSKKFFLEISIPDLFFVQYSSSNVSSQPQSSKNEQFNISTSLSSNPLTNLAIGFRLDL